MKKTTKKAAKKASKPAFTFEDVVDSIPDTAPVYHQLGATPVDEDDEWVFGDSPEMDEKAPVAEAEVVLVESPPEVAVEPPDAIPEPKQGKPTIEDLALTAERLLKVIRFIYGRAKKKITYNPDDIAVATRWVDEADRQLSQLRKK
jgi:hypothetical protein